MSGRHRSRRRRGTTLVELIVVLAILTTVTGLVGLAFSKPAPVSASAADRIAAARRSAIATGRPVVIAFVAESDSQRAIALPDGSVVGADILKVDRLTGRPSDAMR